MESDNPDQLNPIPCKNLNHVSYWCMGSKWGLEILENQSLCKNTKTAKICHIKTGIQMHKLWCWICYKKYFKREKAEYKMYRCVI